MVRDDPPKRMKLEPRSKQTVRVRSGIALFYQQFQMIPSAGRDIHR